MPTITEYQQAIQNLEQIKTKLEEIYKLAKSPWEKGQYVIMSLSDIADAERAAENTIKEFLYEIYKLQKPKIEVKQK